MEAFRCNYIRPKTRMKVNYNEMSRKFASDNAQNERMLLLLDQNSQYHCLKLQIDGNIILQTLISTTCTENLLHTNNIPYIQQWKILLNP